MDKVSNTVLEVIINYKINPSSYSPYHYSHSRVNEVRKYISCGKYTNKGEELINEYDKFINLLNKFDCIGGKDFNDNTYEIKINNSLLSCVISTQFKKGVYNTFLKLPEIFNSNICSSVNKELKKVKESKLIEIKRCNINIKGMIYDKEFDFKFIISDLSIKFKFIFDENHINDKFMTISSIPSHIPYVQQHKYIIKHYQQKEVIQNFISKKYKTEIYRCCNNKLLLHHNFCFNCGKEIKIPTIDIKEVVEEKLESLLK